jgi:two-component system chemotaxis sensor kinase CheA
MNSNSPNTTRYLDLFLSEARNHTEQMEEILIRLPNEEDIAPFLYELFRHAHSLKGMSASMGYGAISQLTHALEEIFSALRNRELALSHQVNHKLMESLAQINEMLISIEKNKTVPEPALQHVETLKHLVNTKGAEEEEVCLPRASFENEPAERDSDGNLFDISIHFRHGAPCLAARAILAIKRCSEIGHVQESWPSLDNIRSGHFQNALRVKVRSSLSEERIKQLLLSLAEVERYSMTLDSKSISEKAETEGSLPLTSIRIKTELLDHFLDGVVDVMIQQQKLAAFLESYPQQEAKYEAEKLERSIKKLYLDVTKVRMLPFSFLSRRFEKSVRNLATRLNKKASLKISGGETELDRSILEEISDPINHIIRNSIDHGIEYPAARRKLKKEETGRIRITLERKRESTIIRIEDDGRGIDIEKVKRLALKEGYITKEKYETMSDQEAFMLVTIPGFSTVKNLTTLSGRGIGLDVVRTKIENLGGKVKIQSRLGGGTSIVFILPISVAMINAFIVRSQDRLLAIPVSSVQKTVRVEPSEIVCDENRRAYWTMNGKPATIFDLSTLLSPSEETAAYDQPISILLFKLGDDYAGLAVDEILSRKNILVKPLGHPLDQLREYSGVALLDKGQIALILDISNIVSI